MSQMRAARADASLSPARAWRAADVRLTLVRCSLAMLARLSPGLAARVLDRLWFRAPHTRPQAEAQACLARARRSTLQVDGHPVAVWQWGGAGPAVLLMHGWGGHAGQLHAFVAPLLAAGLSVVAFDAPAHGSSGPSRHGRRRVTFFEFAAVLHALQENLGPLAGAIAHSGGCTALALAMRQGWRAPSRLVFVAPFCEPAAAVEGFARQFGLGAAPIERFNAHAARWLGLAWQELDIAALPAIHRRAPLLVLHDTCDREVPILQSQRLVDAWPDARLVTTRGAGHRRLLALPQVVEAAVDFLAAGDGQAAAPSGYRPADSRVELDLAYEATRRFWRRVGS